MPTRLHRRIASKLILLLAAGVCAWFPAGAIAQILDTSQAPSAAEDAATPAPAAPSISKRLASVQTEIADLRQRIERLPEDATPARRDALAKELGQLERVEMLLNQQQAAATRVEELGVQKAELSGVVERLRMSGPDEPAPYSLLKLDQLRDELETEVARTDSLAAAVSAAGTAVVDADQVLVRAESNRRLAAEAEKKADDEKRPALAAALLDARLESRIAQETVALRRKELERETISKEVHDLRVRERTDRIEWMARSVVFTNGDLDAKLLEIETARSRARQRLTAAEGTVGYLERDWFEAKRQLDAESTENAELVEGVAAKRLAVDAARELIDAMNKRLEQLADTETVWRRRFELTRGAVATTLAEWRSESEARMTALSIEQRLLSARAEVVSTRLGTVSQRLESIDSATTSVPRSLRDQRTHLRTISETLGTRLQSIDAAQRLHARLLAAIGVRAQNVPLGERLESVLKSIRIVWNAEVWTLGERPITVRKIVIGLFVLLFGILASRYLSRFLGRRIFPRLKMNEGASAAIQSILFYVLVLTFALLALRAVDIPLTAFTVLGGALAIGVGFGSQNVIANFISGLILIAERPVRVGDLVEVGGLHGNVEHIGARSTRIRTGENVDIVVPNSTFLEQNVINWTLTEDRIRTKVVVGVAYGSPTREVTKLLARAADEHGRVHKKPTPIVVFTDFGDNALIFEVHFWITMKRLMDRRIIQSDLRHRIDGLFHEAGIVIAYPQRDVHLDSLSPVAVHLVDNRQTPPTAEADSME